MDWCEWCVANSGRVAKGRPCCIARSLANMPQDQRRAAMRATSQADGADASAALQRRVLEYTAIRLAGVAKEVRQRAYRQQQYETCLADAELLKELVVAAYQRSKAD